MIQIGDCKSGWFRFNNACYKVSTETGTWYEAQRNCNQNRSRLATIHSKEENDFIGSLGKKLIGQRVWIGLKRYSKGFIWTDESSFDFEHWISGEPNNRYQEEDCVEMYPNIWKEWLYKWNDIKCSVKLFYVCKKEYIEGI